MAGGLMGRTAPALFGAAVGALVFVVVHRELPDDAYITLNYARNLAEGGHWGLLADRPSNTATSPLNVWLLAAGVVVTGRPVVAVGALLVVTLAAVGWWADGLRRELGVGRALPYLVVGLLGSSPLLVSTVGLETYLGAAVLLGVARFAAADRVLASGLLVGAAVLVRPDLVVPAVVLALALPRIRWRRRLVALAVGAAVALPWHLFAWVELGGFLPDSVWLKTGLDSWRSADGRVWHFADGWGFYALDYTRATVLTLLPVAAGAAAAVAWAAPGRGLPGRRAALGFAAAGAVHWCGFALLGTAPFGWYLAPSATCLTLTAAIGVCALPSRAATRSLAAAGAALVVASTVFVVTWPGQVAPMSTNWASAVEYSALGADVGRLSAGAPVVAPNYEIGTPAYFCRCPLLDRFGDRAFLDARVQQRLPGMSPVGRAVARVNFWFRDPSRATVARWRLQVGGGGGHVVARWPLANTFGSVGAGELVDRQAR